MTSPVECADVANFSFWKLCGRGKFQIWTITSSKISADDAQSMVASDGAIIGFKSSRVVFVVS